MILDSHQHFWEYDPVRDTWIDDSMEKLRRDFLPEDLRPQLDQNSINGTIAVQADQSEEETRFLLDLAQKNKWIRGVVGWVDLTSRKIEERLAYWAEQPKLCGFRHIVQAEPNDYMLRKDFQHGISLLEQYDFTYDILVYPNQLPAAIQLVESFPDQTFILDHIAKYAPCSEHGDGGAEDHEQSLERNSRPGIDGHQEPPGFRAENREVERVREQQDAARPGRRLRCRVHNEIQGVGGDVILLPDTETLYAKRSRSGLECSE